MQWISRLFHSFTGVTVDAAQPPQLHALDAADIPYIAWYKRLEMAASLADQVKALHESGKVHRLIGMEQFFFNSENQVVLGKSNKEVYDCDVEDREEIVGQERTYVAPERC